MDMLHEVLFPSQKQHLKAEDKTVMSVINVVPEGPNLFHNKYDK